MVEKGDSDLGFAYEIRVSDYLQSHPVIKPVNKRKCTNTIFAVTRTAAAFRAEVNEIIFMLRKTSAGADD